MSRYLFVAVIWAMIASTLAGPFAAFAQSTAGAGLNEQQAQPKIDRRKLIVPPRNPDGSLITTPFFADPMEWLRENQRAFYGALSGAMRSIKSDAPVAAASMLILLSFGYGIFHAAGPGHGKAVISTWLIATENELRRGILIAFMSAGVQALTAIAIVTVLLLIVSAVGSAARNVADFLQSASFALIGGMGLWLMWSAFRPHGHATQEVAARHDHHVHGGHHSEDCGCGHAHFPAARNVKGEWSWIKASSLAFAVHAACVDPDRVLRLLRPLARRSALTATLIARLVPLAAADYVRLGEAAALRGPGAAPVGRAALARRLVAGSLDRAVDVAATLELRGYAHGAPGSARGGPRARYAGRFLAAGVAIAALAVAARIAGVGAYGSYPTADLATGIPTLILAVSIPLLAALPFVTVTWGRRRRG